MNQRMNDDSLNQLFAAARSAPKDVSRLEYGFETRLIAQLDSAPRSNWFGSTWRLVPAFAAVMLFVATYAWFADTDWETLCMNGGQALLATQSTGDTLP